MRLAYTKGGKGGKRSRKFRKGFHLSSASEKQRSLVACFLLPGLSGRKRSKEPFATLRGECRFPLGPAGEEKKKNIKRRRLALALRGKFPYTYRGKLWVVFGLHFSPLSVSRRARKYKLYPSKLCKPFFLVEKRVFTEGWRSQIHVFYPYGTETALLHFNLLRK